MAEKTTWLVQTLHKMKARQRQQNAPGMQNKTIGEGPRPRPTRVAKGCNARSSRTEKRNARASASVWHWQRRSGSAASLRPFRRSACRFPPPIPDRSSRGKDSNGRQNHLREFFQRRIRLVTLNPQSIACCRECADVGDLLDPSAKDFHNRFQFHSSDCDCKCLQNAGDGLRTNPGGWQSQTGRWIA